MSWFYIRLWWGQLNVKHASKKIFSERYGYTPTLTIGPVCFSWRRYTLNDTALKDEAEADPS
jgi:hypothetical protein